MKKQVVLMIVSLILVLVVLTGVLPVISVAADNSVLADVGAGQIYADYDGFEYEIIGDEIVITAYVGTEVNVSIPSQINGYSVTGIGDYAFYCCREIENIIIPDCVKTIGFSAFEECNSLISINIPSGVTFISWSLFARCTSLESVEIPYGVTEIGSYVFADCPNLKKVTIPVTVETIGDDMFTYLGTDVYYCGTKEQWDEIMICTVSGRLTCKGIYFIGDEGSGEASTNDSANPMPSEPTGDIIETPKAMLLGDANDDGVVNIKDVTSVQKYIAGFDILIDRGNADVDLNFLVNVQDTVILQKWLVNLKVEFPIGKQINLI